MRSVAELKDHRVGGKSYLIDKVSHYVYEAPVGESSAMHGVTLCHPWVS